MMRKQERWTQSEWLSYHDGWAEVTCGIGVPKRELESRAHVELGRREVREMIERRPS